MIDTSGGYLVEQGELGYFMLAVILLLSRGWTCIVSYDFFSTWQAFAACLNGHNAWFPISSAL